MDNEIYKGWEITLNEFKYYEANNKNYEYFLYNKSIEKLKIEIDENTLPNKNRPRAFR